MKKQNLVPAKVLASVSPFRMTAACLVFVVLFLVLKSNLSILSKLNVSVSNITQEKKGVDLKSISEWDPLPSPPMPSSQISCDRSHHNYDICSINGPTVLDPTTSTFFFVDSTPPFLMENVKPYPRKWENFTMKGIKELTITSGPSSPKCEVQHNVSALVFSLGGYTGNFWHEFNDAFIPLFITVNSIFPDEDVVLAISKAPDWWMRKYADLLHTFSQHPIINLDKDTATHCFTSATLGLISHGFMTIDPTLIASSKSFIHFRALLDKAYGQVRNNNIFMKQNSPATRPRLVLASRRGSLGRVILNEDEVRRVGEDIGFDVIVFKPTPKTPLQEAYGVINSSHAMIGVHGAALTHSLFLRPGSVFVQVVPLGLEWVAEACFAKAARAMGLEYVEYKVHAEESSLIEKYDRDDLVIRDPVAFRGKGWSEAAMHLYLKEQNVQLDLIRIREYLENAYKVAKRFMQRQG